MISRLILFIDYFLEPCFSAQLVEHKRTRNEFQIVSIKQ